MTQAIASMCKSGAGTFARFLNQPTVKEGVKNVTSSVTFAFGLVEIYDIYQMYKGRGISTENDSTSPQWMRTANKMIIACAKVSLILSSAASRPGMFIISTIAGKLFTTAQLERAFGPNAIFEVNWKHPRHVVSLAAAIFTMPAVAQSVYRGTYWVYKKVCSLQDNTSDQKREPLMTDVKVRMTACFNFVFSRPTLHLGNQFAHYLLRR